MGVLPDISMIWSRHAEEMAKKESERLAAKYNLPTAKPAPPTRTPTNPTLTVTNKAWTRPVQTYTNVTLGSSVDSEVGHPVFPDEPLVFSSGYSLFKVIGVGYDQYRRLCVGFTHNTSTANVIVWKPVWEFFAWFADGECAWAEDAA